jgi:hypothetical protein
MVCSVVHCCRCKHCSPLTAARLLPLPPPPPLLLPPHLVDTVDVVPPYELRTTHVNENLNITNWKQHRNAS